MTGDVFVPQPSGDPIYDPNYWQDELHGLGGDDTLSGLGNGDWLYGDAGSDVLQGGDGNDALTGGTGPDQLDGGAGRDTASYADSGAGVSVDLSQGTGSGGTAEGDALVSIEGVTGSAFADHLTGNGASELHGGAGDDVLVGAGPWDGNDGYLYGEAGDDVFMASARGDRLFGGDGFDTVSYALAATGVAFGYFGIADNAPHYFVAGVAPEPSLPSDSLYSIEKIIGSQFADRLGYADILVGGAGDDVFISGASLWDGGEGNDTISYEQNPGSVNLDLAQGEADGFIISVENVIGNSSNDVLTGNSVANSLQGAFGNDVLRGGAGADLLNGGAGSDSASYANSSAGVTVSLVTGSGSGGDAAGDVLVSIESLTGSAFDDTLTGDGGGNVLNGGAGNDILRGGAGPDWLDGSSGNDLVSYWDSSVGVTANLATGQGSGGDAQGDVYLGIEMLNGSQGNDALTGNTGANGLFGWGGDDILRGGAGADRLDGGAGTDLVSYWDSSVGVTVNLLTGFGSGGDAQGDGYTSVENVNGSQGGDTLIGNAVANVLNGYAGADSLNGGGGQDVLDGGAGKDTLTGGADADRFVFSAVGDSVVGAGADRIADFVRAQGDKIDLSAIDAVTGVAGNQSFTFIGSGLFTHHAGELRAANTSPGVTTIAGDVNGDGVSDFHIVLTGNFALVAGDFVL
ncbi:calcium-binding protein [Inquilinus sp. CA228]|uniref:calcium-binding protein n=1 Tax=Inquilinus sp. CA228 TaxID=3455609 RepID=UPI003F8D72BE